MCTDPSSDLLVNITESQISTQNDFVNNGEESTAENEDNDEDHMPVLILSEAPAEDTALVNIDFPQSSSEVDINSQEVADECIKEITVENSV